MFVYLVWEHQNSDCTSMFIKSSFNWCDRLFESCCSNLRTFRAGSLKDAMILFAFFITQQIAIIMRLMHIDVTEPITNCHRHFLDEILKLSISIWLWNDIRWRYTHTKRHNISSCSFFFVSESKSNTCVFYAFMNRTNIECTHRHIHRIIVCVRHQMKIQNDAMRCDSVESL